MSRPTLSFKFEYDPPTGEPFAIVDGVMPGPERGIYTVEPVGVMPGGHEPEYDWRRQGDRHAPEAWLATALDAAWAEWSDRAEQVRAAESAAGWDPNP